MLIKQQHKRQEQVKLLDEFFAVADTTCVADSTHRACRVKKNLNRIATSNFIPITHLDGYSNVIIERINPL